MIVVYRPEAVSDLRRIARWYRKHRPEGEVRFFERFRAAMNASTHREQFPEAPPRTSIDGAVVHKARVLRTAYSIAFTSQGGTLSILRSFMAADRRPIGEVACACAPNRARRVPVLPDIFVQ